MNHPLSLKIGVSGVRGIVGQSLTPQLVTSFAAAFGTYCGRGPIVLGTDTRPSREMITQAAIAGLLSVGCTPVSLGIVPVPTLQLYTRETKSAGGICATASHNPTEWNALKFVGADGILLRPNQFAELLDLYHQGDYPRVGADEIAELRTGERASSRHQEVVLGGVSVETIRSKKLRVVVDCCNGAGAISAPEFLRTLGCDVVELSTTPTDGFSRNPKPAQEHLQELRDKVRETGADIGFALDSDADRLALVDEKGNTLGEDSTLALVAQHVLSQNPGPVVADISSSRLIDDVAQALQCPIFRTKVGEVNVVEKMIECGAAIGGEAGGGVIAPSLNPCHDSFVGMAYILEALASENVSLSSLRQRLPSYTLLSEQVACRRRDVAPTLRLFRRRFADEKLDLTDGVKVEWPDRWLHVRGSNTEPVLRIRAEANTAEEARELIAAALEIYRP